MNAAALRARYVNDSVGTASPARLVVMLYDRLVLDLVQAEQALDLPVPELEAANSRLCHAQEIVMELHAGLRLDAWAGAKDLARLYAFMLTELIAANVDKDAKRVAACRRLVEPLAEAWRKAAEQLGQ
jgi:flagellar protein FliS